MAAKLPNALHRLTDPGGGFGVDQRQDRRAVGGQGLLEFLQGEGLTPGPFNRDHIGPVAASHIRQPEAEIALHRHQHLVTRFDGVGQGGLHGSTAGATHGDGEAVVGLPGVAKQLLNLPHQLHVEGVEVADRRARQGLEHRGVGIRWTRAQQQTIRGGDRGQGAAMGGLNGGQHGKRGQDPIVNQWW